MTNSPGDSLWTKDQFMTENKTVLCNFEDYWPEKTSSNNLKLKRHSNPNLRTKSLENEY